MSEKKSKLLILYSTVDGHAKHICEYAQDKLKGDKDIIIASLDDDPEHDLSDFDEILLGASVRYGFHRKNVYEFVRENKDELAKKKNGLLFLEFDSKKAGESISRDQPIYCEISKKS